MNSPHQSSVDPNRPAARTFDELIASADEQHVLYKQNSDSAALDTAIRHYCEAFDLDPGPGITSDYVLPYMRFRYAALLRVQTEGGEAAADKYLDKVLSFVSPTHFLRPVLLALQATLYTQRYQHTKDAADLHLAVGILETVMDTIAAAHPQRVHIQLQYGSALHARYIVLQDEDDLNLSIRQFRTVPENCPDDLLVPARQMLAVVLDARYKLRYDINDIDLAVEAYTAVVDKLQQQPREYLTACMGYAVALRARFHRKGKLDDLQVAIKYFEVVIEKCPPSHKYYSAALAYYANLLIDRSQQKESIPDIDKAMECIRNGMAAGREDDTSQPELLSILGFCQITRFILCGSATDLECGVENCLSAVSSHSSLEAAARAGNINRLAFALFSRYQLQGDVVDSSRARAYVQEALDLCPSGHSLRPPILNNSARILGKLGRRGPGVLDLDPDLELSIKYFYESLEHCYEYARSTLLTNLAIVLLYRYWQLGDLSDVHIAFAVCKTSLDMQPEHHPMRGMAFLFQAKAVIAMFPQEPTIVDTEIALDILHASRDAFSLGHPLFIEMYRDLSKMYFLRHSITNNSTDLEHAFEHRRAAAQYSNGGSQTQLETAMQWIESAEEFDHPSLLDAYKSAIRILDLHLVLKPSLDLRHDIIKKQALHICADATSCALRRQDVVGAVEVFEHSRGLFWAFLARLRTTLDGLRSSGPNGKGLADEFENLSRQLETPMTLGDDGEYGQRFRRIQRDWNAVVDKIRSVDGFGRFLLPPSYEDLQVAAIEGPVIILNVSRHSCDAIIVLAHGEPVHVALPAVTYSDINELSSELQTVRRKLRRCSISEREREGKVLALLLRRLWDSIVCAVVRGLEPHVPKNSRIWWCPTGAFTSLPLHAAHPSRKGERGLSDIYISSYTPTLSALVRSRNKRSGNPPQGVPSFVSIGQPDAPGYELLESVHQELDLVRKLIPASVPFTELIDEAATREAALTALSMHTYAHLACHGKQDSESPYQSHFAMRDDHVTLLDIIQRSQSLNQGQGQADNANQTATGVEFAFLSACKTATGDTDAPDEVVHLAAALQFAGVRNVVGTMWSVDDEVVGYIVEAFYRAMVREDGVFDPSRAARALRAAMKATKDKVPLDQRIIFIHIGV